MKKQITPKQFWSYILQNLRPFRLPMAVMFIAALMLSIDLSIRPYLLKIIVDTLSTSSSAQSMTTLLWPILLYLCAHLLPVIASRSANYFVDIKMVPMLRQNLITDAFQRLLEKSHSFFADNFAGSLANRITNLETSVPNFIRTILNGVFSPILGFIIAICTLSQVHVLFGFFILLWTSIFISGTFCFSRRLVPLSHHWSETESNVVGRLVDVLENSLSVKLFVSKRKERARLEMTCQKAVKAEQDLEWVYLWMLLFYDGVSFIVLVLNFYLLYIGRLEGWVTVGDVALVLGVNFSIFTSLWGIAREISSFSTLYGRIKQALDVVLIPENQKNENAKKNLSVVQGEIKFSNVQFSYQDAPLLFEQLSVCIPGGQKVGLVGYSGAGKSTFVALILQLYDIEQGRICIDGQNLQDITQKSLWDHIAMIPQDPSLFQRSIMENILYGKPSATHEEVIAATKKAQLHELVMQLPLGYDTLVGDRGVKLSGGQRQRLAIARAFLKNAPILILDEATSQLDSITENGIQESLIELMRDKTTLVIAHRLSTLAHMDRILVFDKGQIVQDGPHSILFEQKGLYRNLWDAQVGGFLGDYPVNESNKKKHVSDNSTHLNT